MSLREGESYALMGNNGAGKTTLFNILSGFIKPQRGQIIFKQHNITGASPFLINRKGISRTFQDLRICTKLTIKENILLAMKHNPSDMLFSAILPTNFGRKANRGFLRRVEEIIGEFFLDSISNARASEISYGQQKLLTLACCVASDPSLFLLDEPVAGIQPEYRNKVAAIINRLKDNGKTIFFIEHNTDFISEVAHTILFMYNGQTTIFNNIESLRKDSSVIQAYL